MIAARRGHETDNCKTYDFNIGSKAEAKLLKGFCIMNMSKMNATMSEKKIDPRSDLDYFWKG